MYRGREYQFIQCGHANRDGWILAQSESGVQYWLPANDCKAMDMKALIKQAAIALDQEEDYGISFAAEGWPLIEARCEAILAQPAIEERSAATWDALIDAAQAGAMWGDEALALEIAQRAFES